MSEEQQIEKPKLLLAVINNHRYIPNYFFNSAIALTNYCRQYFKVDLVNINAYDVAIMRNLACKIAIDKEFDFIFMLDVDMTYPMDSAFRLFRRWVEAGNPRHIFVGSARQRAPPFKSTQFYKIDTPDFGSDENRVIPDKNSNKVVKIEATGVVGALMPTSLLKELTLPYFENLYRSDGTYIGEDVSFCKKCKDNNIDIYLDPQVSYGHEVVKMIDRDGETYVQ
jgi:hypothetical protein